MLDRQVFCKLALWKQEHLKKKIAKLPENLKLKVESFVDSLIEKEIDQDISKSKVKKGFGGGKGIIAYMADDFDEPLEDFKDYM